MAISIPIISEFVDSGVKKAVKEFKQLETTGQKAQFAIKKAAVPAAAALAGLGAALFDATKGAMEDAAAQEQMAYQITNATGATKGQIASLENWISKQGQLLGVTDDKLRPALSKLATQTGDVAEAQRAATLAMDISAATGKDLDTVTTALAKAYGGNLTALAKLDPGMRDAIKAGLDLDEAMGMLEGRFGGSAKVAAETAEGGFKRLSVSLAETKESIGAALLPIVEKALPVLQKFAAWASENPNTFLAIAGAITAVSVAIMAVNFAMALNPFTAIAAGIALLAVGLAAAYNKFEGFRNVVNATVNFVADAFEMMANAVIMTINAIIRAFNILPGKNIPTISHLSIGSIGGGGAKGGGAGIPKMAEGGIVTSPTLALIGEAGPEAVVPLSKMGGMGGVTINVNGGDPNAVVDALRRYMRTNGAVPIRTAAAI